MSVRFAAILNKLGFSVSHDGDKGWIVVKKEKAAIKAANEDN